MVAPTVLRPADIEQGERRELPVPEPSRQRPPVDEIDVLVARGRQALDEYAGFDQESRLHRQEGRRRRARSARPLAQAAVAETGRGVFEDKAVKNIFACEHVTHSMKYLRTVGVISTDEITGITEIAEPVGVVAGITPVTNPTSTTIFKSLLALKTRNPIVFGFHPAAQRSSAQAARVVRDAAIAAGAPEHCIQWIEHPSIEATGRLMHHSDVATILATGGNAMVRAAYSCGKPALGVGAGNVPAFIEHRNLQRAVNDVVALQVVRQRHDLRLGAGRILDEPIYEPAMADSPGGMPTARTRRRRRCWRSSCSVCAPTELPRRCETQRQVVGQCPQWIARGAGFEVPEETSIILVEVGSVGRHEPLTREKLCPVLAVLRAQSGHGIKLAEQMVELGRAGSQCGHPHR